LQERASILRKT